MLNKVYFFKMIENDGEGGIRTLGALLRTHTISNRAPSARLGHLSFVEYLYNNIISYVKLSKIYTCK